MLLKLSLVKSVGNEISPLKIVRLCHVLRQHGAIFAKVYNFKRSAVHL